MKYSTVLVCAGSGKRTGLKYNKIFHKIGDQTVLEKTANVFLSDERCTQIIIVTKQEEIELCQNLLEDKRIEYCFGGPERVHSVENGLALVKNEYVMIHDGARPYTSRKIIDDVVQSVELYHACVVMVPCKDTIKKVVDGKIVETLERDKLMQAQTPQAFQTQLLKKAYQNCCYEGVTDDSSLVEKYTDVSVHVVVGDYNNIKITTIEDLKN